MAEVDNLVMEIINFFTRYSNVIVAFSSGIDSTVLLHMAKKYAKSVKAVFVKSEFQPEFELNDAIEICKELNVALDVVYFSVFDNEEIVKNTVQRCYYCKKKIFEKIRNYYSELLDDYVIIEGTNISDDVEERAGYKVLQELGVLSPLRMYKFTKSDIRDYAKLNNISNWNKPSYSCLATRISLNTPITKDILNVTEKAENKLSILGFSDFRVRYVDGSCKIQVKNYDFQRIIDKRQEITEFLLHYYNNVFLDLEER